VVVEAMMLRLRLVMTPLRAAPARLLTAWKWKEGGIENVCQMMPPRIVMVMP